MRKFNSTLILLSAFCVAACASSADNGNKAKGIDAFKDDARLGEQVEKICFNRSIDGFSNATRDTVVLSVGVSKDYIAEVRGVCQNLSYAQSIGIDTSLSCVRRGDYLIVSDSAFGRDGGAGLGPDRCLIDRIHKWNKKAVTETDVP